VRLSQFGRRQCAAELLQSRLELAEEELKKINLAYDRLKKKFE
jgi:hypothetical protein